MGQRSCILKLLLQLYLITTHLIPHQYTLPNADQKKICITNDCLMIWRKGTLKAIEDTKTTQCHAPPAQHEIEMLAILEGNLLEVHPWCNHACRKCGAGKTALNKSLRLRIELLHTTTFTLYIFGIYIHASTQWCRRGGWGNAAPLVVT